MAEDILYRARVVRIASEGTYVTVPGMGSSSEFGPIESIDGVQDDEEVIVGRIEDIAEDIVVIARLGVVTSPPHNHDDRYYTEAEIVTLLAGKANSSHTHAQSDVTNLTTELAARELLTNKSTSTSLGTSNTLYPTQNAVKAYVDAQVAGLGGSGLTSLTGEMKLWPTATAPTGYLLCDGTVHNISTYPALGALLGSTYGGNGTTTFGVPDLRGRIPIGVSGTYALAVAGGSATKTLAEANLPAHTHGSGSYGTGSAGNHDHLITTKFTLGSASGNVAAGTSGTADGNTRGPIEDDGAHTHSVTGTSGSTGSGTALDVMNPYLPLNYIIKT